MPYQVEEIFREEEIIFKRLICRQIPIYRDVAEFLPDRFQIEAKSLFFIRKQGCFFGVIFAY